MKSKLAIAISTALVCSSALATTTITKTTSDLIQVVPAIEKSASSSSVVFNGKAAVQKFKFEPDLAPGEYNYIVRLINEPVATYTGDLDGFAATNPQITKTKNDKGQFRLNLQDENVQKYAAHIEREQSLFLSQASNVLGGDAKVMKQFKLALNGMAIRMTQADAAKLANMPNVAYVEREVMYQLDTDTGPIHIGADKVWDGTANGGVEAKGEGVIIGILDTGVNTDNASFADVGGDGYDHDNPWGAGMYVGDCAGDFADLCNDKLIGVFSYPDITDIYDDMDVFGDMPPAKNGEDYNGHGSHTAGTAGGNVLMDVDMLDPEFGEEMGDGINTTGFKFDQISGVAPHANIVSFQVCRPGNSGDTYSGCPFIPIISSIEDAITVGVDVINYSISGGGNPWNSSTELGYLAANAAGIFVATSAGNGGPNPETTPKHAPWYTAVGAATHGRVVAFDKEIGEFTGGDSELTALTGSSASGGITAPIVYAGDYANPNDPEGDPAQCLQPFPEDTFDGQIVVCDRGAIARVQKAINVADGGAGGFVLANLQDGASSVANDVYVVPGIHMDADQGDMLRSWLASGSDHAGTITAAEGELRIEGADVTADFSSRGPSTSTPDVLTPSVTAPGVSIYAAYSDEHYGHDNSGPAPADFAFLQGTSMSSPHVAGAGALLMSAHPDWTPDNVRSALMMTATTAVWKEDGVTPADYFDMGACRIRVDLAAQAGLVMQESPDAYEFANPALGGMPKTLNIPSMADSKCVDMCSWTRTFTATMDGEWTVSAEMPDGAAISVSPESFSIEEGGMQSVTVTVDVSEADAGWNMGKIMLMSEGSPDLHLPVLAMPSSNNIPDNFLAMAGRDKDSKAFEGLRSKDMTSVSSVVLEPALVGQIQGAVGQGTTEALYGLNFAEDQVLLNFTITEAESPDFDLYLYNSSFQIIASAASAGTYESLTVKDLPAGQYYILIYNWLASSEGAVDAFTVDISNAENTEDYYAMDVMSEVMMGDGDFDVKVSWDRDFEMYGDFAGLVVLSGAEGEPSQSVLLDVTRTETDDVDYSSVMLEGEVAPGATNDVVMAIAPNFSQSDRTYMLTAELPAGHEVGDISHDGMMDGTTISWTVVVPPAGSTSSEEASVESYEPTEVMFELIPRMAGTGYMVTLSNQAGSDTDPVMAEYTFDVPQVAPTAVASRSSSQASEGSPVVLRGSGSYDDNDDAIVSYTWTQTEGPAVNLDASAADPTFTAPEVTTSTMLTFQLVVNDGTADSAPATTSVQINNRETAADSSSSMGWLVLLAAPLAWMRRRKA